MNTKELKKLLDYIQKNNSWENLYYLHEANRYCYKYVYVCYDTRDTDDNKDPHVWRITLANGGQEISFEEHECTYENIKKFLDLPFTEAARQLSHNGKERY